MAKKNPAAMKLGRLGGLTRTRSLSAEKRAALSRKGGNKGGAARKRNLGAEGGKKSRNAGPLGREIRIIGRNGKTLSDVSQPDRQGSCGKRRARPSDGSEA